MNDKTFQDCMKEYTSGEAGSQMKQRDRFCVGSKICSGQAKDVEEAQALCKKLSRQPTDPSAEEVMAQAPKEMALIPGLKTTYDGIMRSATTCDLNGLVAGLTMLGEDLGRAGDQVFEVAFENKNKEEKVNLYELLDMMVDFKFRTVRKAVNKALTENCGCKHVTPDYPQVARWNQE